MKFLSDGRMEKNGEIILLQQDGHCCCYTVIAPYKNKDWSFVEISVLSLYYNDPGLRWLIWQRIKCAWRALRGRLWLDWVELHTEDDCDRLIEALKIAKKTAWH